jgi:hypothetical protein
MVTDRSYWDSIKGNSEAVLTKLKALVHEGNVRRIVVIHDGRTVAELPLTAGVVGAVIAPALAAVGAIIALLKDCTIEVEKAETDAKESEAQRAAGL